MNNNNRPPSGALRASPCVLIVEDDPGDAQLVRWQLLEKQADGFEILIADSLAAASRLLESLERDPDVVLLDLNLPDSTGAQTVLRCRELTEAPIVVLTGLDPVAAASLAFESGAEDFITKGTDASVLRRTIRYAILRHARDADARLAATVFTHAREGIIITDPAGAIVEANQAFADLSGYAISELIGRNPRMLGSGRHPPDFFHNLWADLGEKGHWYGEIWNRNKQGEVFAVMVTIGTVFDLRGRVRHYVGLFSDITLQKAHEQQLEHIAHYDALTGLTNRVLLGDRLRQAMMQCRRRSRQMAVVFIDLDGFKAVNDQHGHDCGDALLVAISSRMREALREGDTLARIGGDEFVALITDLSNAQSLEPMLERLLAVVAEPFRVREVSLQVSASVGVAMYPQHEELDGDQLLRQADQAMYAAKQAGKNRYHFFDVERDRDVRERIERNDRVQQGLKEGEFELYFQPKVNMRDGRVFGVEALLRWRHPEHGVILPGEFLHSFESTPLAVLLGEWVIEAALKQMAAWGARGLKLPVSVNISAQHLQSSGFVSRLSALLDRYPHVSPDLLELEILESSALEEIELACRVITECGRMGVQFSLDDFGTGYSSLSYLKRLPVACLKIDRSFVRDMLDDPDDLAILEGVIGLASAFKRQVIAEGVESERHGLHLLVLGCDIAQGYGIARPMPADQLEHWIGHWSLPASWRRHSLATQRPVSLVYACAALRNWVKSVEGYLCGERDRLELLDAGATHFMPSMQSDAESGASGEFVRYEQTFTALREQVQALVDARPGTLLKHDAVEIRALWAACDAVVVQIEALFPGA